MANILQVSSSPITPDPSINQRISQDPSIKNPVSPGTVNRADGQNTGQTGTATGEGSFSGVDFEGNYAAFLKELSQTANLPKALETVLFGDGALALSQEKGEIGQVMEELFSSMEMESPEDLKAFLQDQQKAQIKFSGNLFNIFWLFFIITNKTIPKISTSVKISNRTNCLSTHLERS